MIEHLATQWQLHGEPVWAIVAGIVGGVALSLIIWLIIKCRERRKWKLFHEKHGPVITNTCYYDEELTPIQIMFLADQRPPE